MESVPVKLLDHYLHLDQDVLQLWLSLLLIYSLRYVTIGSLLQYSSDLHMLPLQTPFFHPAKQLFWVNFVIGSTFAPIY